METRVSGLKLEVIQLKSGDLMYHGYTSRTREVRT